jgi:hypothetical protein
MYEIATKVVMSLDEVKIRFLDPIICNLSLVAKILMRLP